MKILVLGGSYFFGRVFVMEAAKEYDITVVNRGTYSMEAFGVNQLKGDRNDTDFLETITDDYDVLVDFCGYQKGDVSRILDHVQGKIGHYIFISTVDVFRRGISGYKTEDTPLENRVFPGEAGEYISGKVLLEQELCAVCEEKKIPFTILRPAILYGPFNYAPREGVFIQLMVQQGLLPRITDADGSFQMVYVKDAAQAVLSCIGNEKTFGNSYNLCGDETVTYSLLADALWMGAESIRQEKRPERSCGIKGTSNEENLRQEQECEPIKILPMTVIQAQNQGLPLSFPLTKEETELYSNTKSKEELGMEYISLQEGMARTCRAFWNVYLPTR